MSLENGMLTTKIFSWCDAWMTNLMAWPGSEIRKKSCLLADTRFESLAQKSKNESATLRWKNPKLDKRPPGVPRCSPEKDVLLSSFVVSELNVGRQALCFLRPERVIRKSLSVKRMCFFLLIPDRFDVIVHLERKPTFYLWNVVFVNCFVTLASLMAFNMDAYDVGGRASVLLTLLLTTVGHKLIVCSWMPTKPYLTFLDKYIIACFVVQFLAITESIVIVRFMCSSIDETDSNWEDGKYSGEYVHRLPPSHECMPAVEAFEKFFVFASYELSWNPPVKFVFVF